MLLFDLTVQVTVGSVWAMSHREKLTRPETKPFDTKAFHHGLLYSLFLYVPSAVFFLYAWPGWNSMYLFDIETKRIWGSWFAFLDSVALFGCYILGFWVTVRWLRKGQGKIWPTLCRLAGIWVVVNILLFVVLYSRSFTVTTYPEFMVGTRLPFLEFRWGDPMSFFGNALMYWLVVWCVLDFVPLVFFYWCARKKMATKFF